MREREGTAQRWREQQRETERNYKNGKGKCEGQLNISFTPTVT